MDPNFPFFVHVITVPLTLAVGFFLGWFFRSEVGKRAPRRPGGTDPRP